MSLLAQLVLALAATLSSAQEPWVSITAWYPDDNLNGESIYIRGDFGTLSWSKGLLMQASGLDQWSLQIPLKRGAPSGHFKVLVGDTTWEVGANHALLFDALWDKANATAASVEVFPWFGQQPGTYSVAQPAVFSPQLQNFRSVVVYTPPSYTENPYKSYDVLIMHDGQNLFNASTSSFGTAWQCQDTLNTLVAEGDMREIVVVGVYNIGANRTYEYTYSVDPTVHDGGGGDAYLDFLEGSLYPWVQTAYRVKPLVRGTGPDAARWSMLGSSLGGLLSCYAGWTRPDVYARVGCMSSSFWWNGEDFNNTVLQHAPPVGPSKPDVVFYLDSGNAGPDNDDVVQTHTVFEHLKSDGYALNSTLFYYTQPGGQHSEKYWGERFGIPMQDLFPVQGIEALPMHVAKYVSRPL